MGITHVLNVTDNIPNYFETNGEHYFINAIDSMNIQYENIFIGDFEDSPIQLHFSKAYDFIDRVLFGEDQFTHSSSDFEEVKIKSDNSRLRFVHDESDIQTLKLDISEGTIGEWSHCDIKKAAFHIDDVVSTLRSSQPKTKVLVHCAMGKSRSATIVMMYLMKKFLLSFKTAKSIVEARRETVEVNSGFLCQLQAFEKYSFKFSAESSDDDGDSTEGEECTLISE